MYSKNSQPDYGTLITGLVVALAIAVGFVLAFFQSFFPVFIMLTLLFVALVILTKGEYYLLNRTLLGLIILDVVSGAVIIWVVPSPFGQMCLNFFNGFMQTNAMISDMITNVVKDTNSFFVK